MICDFSKFIDFKAVDQETDSDRCDDRFRHVATRRDRLWISLSAERLGNELR